MSIWYSEFVKAVFAVAVLLTIGQWLSHRWNWRQKRRESQSSALQQFYSAYGEFFAVWKIWNHLDRFRQEREVRRWELHMRAASAEGIVEGIIVKLASEVTLCDEHIEVLGSFRQGFQQLRESIRADKPLPWHSSDNLEYQTFKTLAVRVSALLAGKWEDYGPSVDIAAAQVLRITSNQWESNWVVF